MRILVIVNQKIRDLPIMLRIKQAINRIDKNAEVELIDPSISAQFVIRILQFQPDVILTQPFTPVGLSMPYYIAKYLMKCLIVCLYLEGIFDYQSKKHIDLMIGYERYGPQIVDYQMMWGKRTANVLGDILLEQGKITSIDRVIVTGYPYFERYFEKLDDVVLPEQIKNAFKAYPREKRILFVTGFNYADLEIEDFYKQRDIIDLKSTDVENEINLAMEGVEKIRKRRIAWINKIIETARVNPSSVIIVKRHPQEAIDVTKDCYLQPFSEEHNIIYLREHVPLAYLLPQVYFLIHYGSTSVLESYMTNTISIYDNSADCSKDEWLSTFMAGDFGMPSHIYANIDDVPDIIKSHDDSSMAYSLTFAMRKELYERLNIDLERDYKPSDEIARFLLAKKEPQNIERGDPYLYNSIRTIGKDVIQHLLIQANQAMNRKDFDSALKSLDIVRQLADAGEIKVIDLDFLRAVCFLHLQCYQTAKQVISKAKESGDNSNYDRVIYFEEIIDGKINETLKEIVIEPWMI